MQLNFSTISNLFPAAAGIFAAIYFIREKRRDYLSLGIFLLLCSLSFLLRALISTLDAGGASWIFWLSHSMVILAPVFLIAAYLQPGGELIPGGRVLMLIISGFMLAAAVFYFIISLPTPGRFDFYRLTWYWSSPARGFLNFTVLLSGLVATGCAFTNWRRRGKWQAPITLILAYMVLAVNLYSSTVISYQEAVYSSLRGSWLATGSIFLLFIIFSWQEKGISLRGQILVGIYFATFTVLQSYNLITSRTYYDDITGSLYKDFVIDITRSRDYSKMISLLSLDRRGLEDLKKAVRLEAEKTPLSLRYAAIWQALQAEGNAARYLRRSERDLPVYFKPYLRLAEIYFERVKSEPPGEEMSAFFSDVSERLEPFRQKIDLIQSADEKSLADFLKRLRNAGDFRIVEYANAVAKQLDETPPDDLSSAIRSYFFPYQDPSRNVFHGFGSGFTVSYRLFHDNRIYEGEYSLSIIRDYLHDRYLLSLIISVLSVALFTAVVSLIFFLQYNSFVHHLNHSLSMLTPGGFRKVGQKASPELLQLQHQIESAFQTLNQAMENQRKEISRLEKMNTSYHPQKFISFLREKTAKDPAAPIRLPMLMLRYSHQEGASLAGLAAQLLEATDRFSGFIQYFSSDTCQIFFPDQPQDALNFALAWDRMNRRSDTAPYSAALHTDSVVIGLSETRQSGMYFFEPGLTSVRRIADLGLRLGCPVIISDQGLQNLKILPGNQRLVAYARFRENSARTALYEIFDNDDEKHIIAKRNSREKLKTGIEQLRSNGYKEAAETFRELNRKFPEDQLVRFYLSRSLDIENDSQ